MSGSAGEIAEKVVKIVAGHLGVAEASVVPEAAFVDDLGADSLDTVELVMAFEDSFGIYHRETPAPPYAARIATSPHTAFSIAPAHR